MVWVSGLDQSSELPQNSEAHKARKGKFAEIITCFGLSFAEDQGGASSGIEMPASASLADPLHVLMNQLQDCVIYCTLHTGILLHEPFQHREKPCRALKSTLKRIGYLM